MKIALKNKRVLVLGLGETGLSALRWLNTQGAHLSVADTRDNPPGVAACVVATTGFIVACFNPITF